MTELNDYNISQLEFVDLPSDKELTYIMHGNIYEFKSDFYINGVFIDDDKKFYISLLPLKGLSTYPLGTIFKDKKVTSNNTLNKVIDIQIKLNKKTTGFTKIKDIEILKNKFSKIPDKISGYTGQNKVILNQFVSVYKDRLSEKILYIPHYEIARWYYLRSSSLTRQVLSSNLKGLYYEAKYLDTSNSKAELIMKHGSNNTDASEIFRFIKNDFANIMFQNFSLDLSANKHNINSSYNSTKIKANFPIYGELNLKIKGFPIGDNSIFVYQFIEEDSTYPFDELNVYRYGANKNREIGAVIHKKSPGKNELKQQINYNTPSSEFVNQTTSNDVSIEELRKGLENKKIKYKPVLEPNEDTESVIKKKIKVSGTNLELSFNDASADGDKNTLHSSLIHQQSEDYDLFQERENNLSTFRRILFKLIDINKNSNEQKELSINILNHGNLPGKPKDYKGKAKWAKARLSNGKARQYMLAQVVINTQYFYLIEIERDNIDDTIATIVLYQNHSILNVSIFYTILHNYVKDNGKWSIPENINKLFLYHTGDNDSRANRLYKKLK